MKLLAIIMVLVLLVSCNMSSNSRQDTNIEQAESQITRITIDQEMHNFGTLQAGEVVSFSFKITNSGDNNLVIKEVDSDCGCINAEYPVDPIIPGESVFIEITFNTSGLYGKQFKTITVHINAKEPKHLAIFAEVINEQLEIQY